jgi:hypothetical protein
MDRKCKWCGDDVPEGHVGPYCSREHEWLFIREKEKQLELPLQPVQQNGVWGRSPRARC